MIKISTKSHDNGLLSHIRSVIGRFDTTVEVGYLDGAMHRPSITSGRSKPITLKYLASIHEKGLGVPKRPFIAPAIEKNGRKYFAFISKELTPIFRRRRTINAAWEKVGTMAVADIQQYMVTARFTPLAPITIKRKGSSKPLIDTGQMRQSITYRVK